MTAFVVAFVVTVPAGDVDLASDQLWQLGVRAIEERRSGDGATVELWTSVGYGDDARSRADAALDGCAAAAGWSWRFTDVANEQVETWRRFAEPMWIDDTLVIVPAWQELVVDDGVTSLPIEPGGAFGLGDHPTTELSLRALMTVFDAWSGREPPRVLDVGCGTGVLAIAAARLGARTVRAIDVASAAVESTVDNARRNGVADAIDCDTTPIAAIDDAYDIVVANILAPTLVAMSADLGRVCTRTGTLIVSGILHDAHDHVLEALSPMRVVERLRSGDWAAVVLGHA